MASAREAFPRWRALPAPKRGEILYRAAEILVRRKEELSRDMTREMGKVLAETRGDVQEAIDMTYYMAGEGRRQFGQTTPSEMPSKFQMSIRQPVGVAGLITPWNFPMAIPSWKMMPALVLGNTVVIKPATDTPLSVVNLLKALEEAGLPPGVVNMVTGGGVEVGAPLMHHREVGIVSFTGSTGVGRKVSEACAPAFKHCHLEMGGKNIIMVMDDANLDLAVDGAVWGGFGTTGQRCTAASRVAVHKKVYAEFTAPLRGARQGAQGRQRPGVGVQMGPCVNESQRRTVEKYVKIAQDEGAKLLTGGRRLEGGAFARGFFHEPTIFGDCDPEDAGLLRGDLRAGGLGDPGGLAGGGHRGRQLRGVRPLGLASTRRTSTRPSWPCATCTRGSSTSTRPPSARRPTCPSAAPRTRATATARPACRPWTCSREWKSIYIDYSGTPAARADRSTGESRRRLLTA